ELPSLAIELQDGDVRLDARPDGSARIAGSVRSGEGTLHIDGTLGWQGDDTPLVLALKGENVLLSDTRDLHAVANPDVQVRYAAKQPLQVTGTVTVPSARLDLERLDQGVSASPDVLVLDPANPEETGEAPLDMDLTIALGDDVKLAGFGLKGTLGGRLRVRARPGREMTASGRLDVEGRYTAYGQELQITRGALVWSNGPVADPILDIRAEREVGEVAAGAGMDGSGHFAIRGAVVPRAGPPVGERERRRKPPAQCRRRRAGGRRRHARLAAGRGDRPRRRRGVGKPRAGRQRARHRQVPVAEGVRRLWRLAARHRPGAHVEVPAAQGLRHRDRIEHGGEPCLGELAQGEIAGPRRRRASLTSASLTRAFPRGMYNPSHRRPIGRTAEVAMAELASDVPARAELPADLAECDRALMSIGPKIKVLKAIDWPAELEQRFLASWQRGAPELPVPPAPAQALGDEVAALEALMRRIDRGHPIGHWLFKTAWSYAVAARMLTHAGTPEFTRCSTMLYGRPDFQYRSQDVTNVDSAREMLAITDELVGNRNLPPVPCDIPADEFAQRLRERIGPFFSHDKVDVVLDPALSSKATAGSKGINLRATALFSERDLEQLTQHEAFIHTLTLLNGKHQPQLRSLGLGSPR